MAKRIRFRIRVETGVLSYLAIEQRGRREEVAREVGGNQENMVSWKPREKEVLFVLFCFKREWIAAQMTSEMQTKRDHCFWKHKAHY